MAATKIDLKSLALELKVEPSDITDFLASKNLTFDTLTDAHLTHTKTHFIRQNKIVPPAPPIHLSLGSDAEVKKEMVPKTNLTDMTLEELEQFFKNQEQDILKAEWIERITGNTGRLLEVQDRTLELDLTTQKSQVKYDVKNDSQTELLDLSKLTIQRVQKDVTDREIQALKDYETETLKTFTNGQVGVLAAKKLRRVQEARVAKILNSTPLEIPLLSESNQTVTTIDA